VAITQLRRKTYSIFAACLPELVAIAEEFGYIGSQTFAVQQRAIGASQSSTSTTSFSLNDAGVLTRDAVFLPRWSSGPLGKTTSRGSLRPRRIGLTNESSNSRVWPSGRCAGGRTHGLASGASCLLTLQVIPRQPFDRAVSIGSFEPPSPPGGSSTFAANIVFGDGTRHDKLGIEARANQPWRA